MPHVPQFARVVVWVSQPFVLFESQSPYCALHAPSEHVSTAFWSSHAAWPLTGVVQTLHGPPQPTFGSFNATHAVPHCF